MEEDKRNLFLNQIEAKDDSKTKRVVERLKTGEIAVEDLTETQKNEIYKFLEKEVIRKNAKLQELKNKIFNEKIEELKDIDINDIIDKLSKEDRNAFIEFLNNKL